MAEKRAFLYFNIDQDLTLIQDYLLFKYWFHVIANILIIIYPIPLSEPALIQVPPFFLVLIHIKTTYVRPLY